MDIWIARLNKTAICSDCGMPIKAGEPCVFGRIWTTRSGEGVDKPTKWVKKLYWHVRRPDDGRCCWIEQGIIAMEKRGYVERRGRKALGLSEEDKLKRIAILRRRARVMQRLRFETMLPPEQQDVDKVIHLGGQLGNLKEEIQLVGGVPKSWV